MVLMKDMVVPQFSGNVEEFMDWRIGLRRYMSILANETGDLSNDIKMEILSRALDRTNQIILQGHQEKGGKFDAFM